MHTKTAAAETDAYTGHQDSESASDMHGFLPGETVEVVCWVYIPSEGGPLASEVSIRVVEYYSGDWNVTTLDTAATRNRWEKLSGRIVLNSATAGIRVESVFASDAELNEFYYVDDLEVYRYPTFTLAREDNLIDRGNCESATLPGILGETGSASGGGSAARSSEQKRSGEYSIKCTGDGTANQFRWIDGSSSTNMHGIVPGETIEVEVWVYIPPEGGPLATEVRLDVAYYDGGSWTRSSQIASVQDKWEKLSRRVVVPDTATGFSSEVELLSAHSAGEYFYFDDVVHRRHSVPGTHYLSGGYTEHLVELPSKFTLQMKFKPNFAYDVGSNQHLAGCRNDSTHEFRITYDRVQDRFRVIWEDGGTQRYLQSDKYDDGTSYRNINQWLTLTVAVDTTTGSSSGSSLWMDKTQDDTSWSGTIDEMTTKFNFLRIRTMDGGDLADCDIAFVRFFPDFVATDAQVQNDFKDVEDEEIYWSFDGHATGETRCHILSDLIGGISTERGVVNRMSGASSANTLAASLLNLNGEFSDDQNAAFDAPNRVYNGTAAQNYLQRKCRVRLEDWYSGDFDNVFVGNLSTGFVRSSLNKNFSTVNIGAFDRVQRMNHARVDDLEIFEDCVLSGSTEANSLMHLLPRLASQGRVKQYLANNSFEDATIADAWTADGGAWTRDITNPLFGSAHGRLIPGGSARYVSQRVDFTGDKKLSVGQVFTFYVWVHSTAAASGSDNYIAIQEHDSGVSKGGSSTTYTLPADDKGWFKVEVSHTIADSDSDSILVIVKANGGDTIDVDGAVLIDGETSLNWFEASSYVQDSAASSGVISADKAVANRYDAMGFDVEAVTYTHPWKRCEQGSRVWRHVSSVAEGVAPMYGGIDENGTFRLRAVLRDSYSDPVPMHNFVETDIEPGISTNLTMRKANRLEGHGARIVKDGFTRNLWRASESGAFEKDELGQLSEVVLNGSTWPDADLLPFFATYRGVKPREAQETDPNDDPSDELSWFQNVWASWKDVGRFLLGRGYGGGSRER